MPTDRSGTTTTIPGAPSDDAHDLLTGVSRSLADQFQLPAGDIDVARLLDTYDNSFSKRLGRDLAVYANQLIHIINSTLGDRTGRQVTRDAVADGLRNLPDRDSFQRTARVHAIVQAVTEAAATICTQRQAEDVLFDQRITTSRADQLDSHPKFARYAAYVQRGLLLTLAPVAAWLVLFVARRMNGWPGGAPSGARNAVSEYTELAPFAVSVVLLGVVTALVVASERGAAALKRMVDIDRAATVIGIGASLAGLVGALTGTSSSWAGTTPVGDVVLGAVVWALLGAVGFLIAFTLVALVVNHEAAETVTTLLSRSLKLDAEKQEKQALAAKEATAQMHDAALYIVGSRADVLVTHYYRVNTLVRRNSRSGDLLAFVDADIRRASAEIGNGATARCVCGSATEASPPLTPSEDPTSTG
jgi:hypothetical protein